MNIRRVTEKDIEQIVDIKIRGWQSAYKGIIDDEYLLNMNKEERIKKMQENYMTNGFVVAEIENEIVGFCRYTYENIYSSQIDNIDGEICALYIKPKYKRRGIGQKLFQYAINDLRNNKNKRVILWCLKENKPSREFYEKMGGKLFIEKNIEIGGKDYEEVGYVYDVEDTFKKLNTNKAYGELKLVFPTEEYKAQMEEYLQEHFANGEYELAGDAGLDHIKDFDKWLRKVRNELSEETIESGKIPATLFLGVRKLDNKVVGTIQIRHYLNESLLKNGGHIGDGIRPSERRKGYATEMIRLALEECKKIGIKRVLMVCFKDNIGSMKSIKNNGGILENEIPAEDGKIDQRYWISLKKRFADDISKSKNILKTNQRLKSIDRSDFTGDMYLKVFEKVAVPYFLDNGLCLIDNDYKWVEFYDYNSKIKLTAMYDENDEVVEWYFDISRKLGKENNIPYEDDLYLDVLMKSDGEVILLDEDEFKEAFEKMEMTKEEFNEGYKLANDLIKRIKGNKNKVKAFTDKYLKEMLEEEVQ